MDLILIILFLLTIVGVIAISSKDKSQPQQYKTVEQKPNITSRHNGETSLW